MISKQEIQQLEVWNKQQTEDININLITTESFQSSELIQFCEKLSYHAPKILIDRIDAGSSDNIRSVNARPVNDRPVKIRSGENPHIEIKSGPDYYAVPLENELEPFLAALNINNTETPSFIKERVETIKTQKNLNLYVARQCPFCPVTVRQLLPLTTQKNIVHLNIIDAGFFPEMAQADNILSVPSLILYEDSGAEQFRWTGSITIEEVLDILTNNDPVSLSADSMERMLKEGNAELLSRMMIEKERIFPEFYGLLASENWSVRLGAMVVVENISEKNNSLICRIIPELWKLFYKSELTVQGDIVYIIGISGSQDNLSRLNKIVKENYADDVKDAAIEAIDNIKTRSS